MKKPKKPGKSHANVYSILSLVFGILFFIPFAPILAIIFGFVALNQIKRTKEPGRGMAIAGIILGFFWVLMFILLIILAIALLSSAIFAGLSLVQ